MNSEVIIGGLTIIGISIFFLLPGLISNIVVNPVKEETDLGRITGDVVADNPNTQLLNDVLNNFKDSLSVLKPVTYPVFFPIFFIGLITIIVGFRVE